MIVYEVRVGDMSACVGRGADDRRLGGPDWQAGEGQREGKKGGEMLKTSTWTCGTPLHGMYPDVRSIRHGLHCAVIVGTVRPSVMRYNRYMYTEYVLTYTLCSHGC